MSIFGMYSRFSVIFVVDSSFFVVSLSVGFTVGVMIVGVSATTRMYIPAKTMRIAIEVVIVRVAERLICIG